MKTPLPVLAIFFVLSLAPTLHAQTATQVWVTRFNGPDNGNDYASAVAVDGMGNAIVTGRSANLLNSDYYTARYAVANGALLWEQRYDGPANRNDFSVGVAADSAGNAAVTGFSLSGTNYDYYTARYAAADGHLLWEKRYDGTGNGTDLANSVVMDGAGNVSVTGQSTGATGNSDCYTAKYAAADGALLWEKRYNGPADSSDVANGVAVDKAGNVAITGYSGNATGNNDYYTAKYATADGALLWEQRYNGPDDSDDNANAIVVDYAGNVAVTGQSYNGTNADFYTAKYAAADGALLWEKRYNGPDDKDDIATSLAVDSAGNVIITGGSFNAFGYEDYYTAKYAAASGALLWEKRTNGTAAGNDHPVRVVVDSAGNVVVTGTSSTNGSIDYYTLKYAAADGHVLWEARYNDPIYSGNEARGLALAPDGGAVVTGISSNGVNYDYATVRYAPPAGDADSDGLQDWWEQMWWGTTSGHSALNDFDRDGIPELLEMAFGLNPTQPDSNALPRPFVEGGYLTMSFTKHPGVNYQVQSAGTPDAAAFSAATTTVLINDTTLKVRDNVLLGSSPSRYMRVKVTAAP